MHAYAIASDERASVSVVFVGSPEPLACSGKPPTTGVPSVVVDSKYCSLTRTLVPDTAPLGKSGSVRGFEKEAVTVTAELETPFCW